MERIKQALELARQERQKNAGVATNKTGTVKTQKSVAEQEIQYTETRSVDMPVRELREKRIIIDQQNAISDAYRLLRTQILQRLNEKNWNTLAITSPGSGAGKSLTAINLAISLAREVDNTVLLVDANLRSPRIQNYFNFHSEYGLSDYLSNDVALGEMLVHPAGIPRFVVLPAGHAISNSSEMLSSPKMNRLVEELKSRYPSRIVLFDLPPLLESSDALAFLPNVDASLVVVEEGETKEQELRQAFEILQGNEVIGTVLNKAYTRDRDYGALDVKQGMFSQLLNKLSKKSLPSWMS
ncbi:MAG: polysaccharide biosynthesis tyrosine autokinase [Gammaproteobacteria bacterium]|nr:polysaccharide biosynthesis tyrosine autokinase [Gammaproteobacteria bacterium]